MDKLRVTKAPAIGIMMGAFENKTLLDIKLLLSEEDGVIPLSLYLVEPMSLTPEVKQVLESRATKTQNSTPKKESKEEEEKRKKAESNIAVRVQVRFETIHPPLIFANRTYILEYHPFKTNQSLLTLD